MKTPWLFCFPARHSSLNQITMIESASGSDSIRRIFSSSKISTVIFIHFTLDILLIYPLYASRPFLNFSQSVSRVRPMRYTASNSSASRRNVPILILARDAPSLSLTKSGSPLIFNEFIFSISFSVLYCWLSPDIMVHYTKRILKYYITFGCWEKLWKTNLKIRLGSVWNF